MLLTVITTVVKATANWATSYESWHLSQLNLLFQEKNRGYIHIHTQCCQYSHTCCSHKNICYKLGYMVKQ